MTTRITPTERPAACVAPSAAKISGIAMTAAMAMIVVRFGVGMPSCRVPDPGRRRRARVESRRDMPAAPVTCTACHADAFAVTWTGDRHVHLRCGACGLRQDRTLDARTATRFREHHDATRRQIARVLTAMLRAAALER